MENLQENYFSNMPWKRMLESRHGQAAHFIHSDK
jgi:hypothetical protein